jgi:hypothetical protein
MNVADTPRKQKSSGKAEPSASRSADVKTAGEGTEPRSVQDVLSICRDTRNLSRQDQQERIETMRRMRRYLDDRALPLDPGEAEALWQAFGALRYTPIRRAPARKAGDGESDGKPHEQLLKERAERQQEWDELMQSLRGKSR